jgi:hypothetical protein
VDDDAPHPPAFRRRHVDRLTLGFEDSPENGGTEVAESGALSAGQHGGHEAPVARQPQVADGVHASVHSMYPPPRGPAPDGTAPKPEREQLAVCHDPVLSPSQLGQPSFDRLLCRLIPHTGTK